MKRFLLASLLGMSAAAVALPAVAQLGGGRGERMARPGHFPQDRPHFHQERPQPPQGQQFAGQQGHEMPAGGGRMSPEERRQLRRDINEAGRDLYPPRERPPRH